MNIKGIGKKEFQRKLHLLDEYIKNPNWETWTYYANYGTHHICDLPIEVENPFFSEDEKCNRCPFHLANECLCYVRYNPSVYYGNRAAIIFIKAIEFRATIRIVMGC